MTILFLDDWYDKHPGAIIDTETSNKSFLRYSALLRDMGIKNHAFCLALHNKELQGIDPFDPNLSIEQIMMIALEAKENFWFYVRSLCKVPGTGLQRTPFRANRGNIALYWLFFNHVTMSLIQPRQTGKSFSTDMLHSYCLNIASTDTYIAMLTKDETLRGRALSRLKDIIDELPYYLNQKTKKDVANTEEISIKRLDNRYRGLLPSKSPKAAMNVGRGLTAPIFHIDEIAFIYNIAITLPAALPATTAARAIADSKGEPYGNIFTTTAGKKDDPDGRYAYEIVTNSAVWSEKFLDAANINELEKLIRANSPGGEFRVNCTFSHRQLGYSDAWLKEQLEITGSKGEDADRDYFNIWTAGNQSSPFPVEIAERIRKSENPDPYIEISKTYGYITRWYIPLESIEQRMRASHYILGVDTSDAVGRDDIGLVLRDIKTGAVIADATINETNIIVFTKWLAQWLITYDNITLIIERRSSGASIIDLLLILLVEANINPFQRIYNKVVQERDEKPERFAEVSKRFNYNATELINKYKATFGFATSGGGVTSRTELYSTTLTNATKNTCDMVHSKQIIDQMLGLVIKNGRVDHQDGEHDDLVIGFLLSYWMMTQGKNLSFYGINTRDILVSNPISNNQRTSQDQTETLRQKFIQDEINALVESIQNEKNEFLVFKYESKLKRLAEELNNEEAMHSIDKLLETIKESKRINRKMQNNFKGYGTGYSRFR